MKKYLAGKQSVGIVSEISIYVRGRDHRARTACEQSIAQPVDYASCITTM